MSEFKTILKKDMRDVWRTKKFLLYFLIAVAMCAFAFMMLGIMQLVMKYAKFENGTLQLEAMFEMSTTNSTSFFVNFLISYFLIATVIFIRNIVSKEIAENKWTLPLQAGIKPGKLILSKIIVYLFSILAAVALAMVLHLIITLVVCKPQISEVVRLPGVEPYLATQKLSYGAAIGKMLASYANVLAALTFIIVSVLTLNTITKKSWPAIIIPLAVVIVVAQVCEFIEIGKKPLSLYLPFLFFREANGATGEAGFLQYIIATAVTIAVLTGMVIWAINKSKVTGLQDKRSEE